MKKELTNNFILLLLLYADNKKPVIGRTRLQKLVFMYEKECHKKINQKKDKDLFDFYGHDFGPFSTKLYSHVNILKKYGFIDFNYEFNRDEFESDVIDSNTKYSINKAGIECVEEEILQKSIINVLELDILNNFKMKYNNQDLNQLIKFVYEMYPKYTNKSKIKEKVLGNDN